MGLLDSTSTLPPVQSPIPSGIPGLTPPQAAPLPAPMPVAARPSLLERIGHALSAAEGGVSNAIRPVAPGGYGDLLTPDEIASARPSLLHSLIGAPDSPSSDERYRQNLDAMVQRKQAGVAVQRQRALLQDQQDFGSQNPMPASGDESTMGPWINRTLAHYAQVGNLDMVQRLSPIADAFAKARAARVPGQLFQNDKTHEIQSFDTSAGQSIPAGWSKLAAGASGTYKQYMDPQGHTHVLPESVEPPPNYKPVSTSNIIMGQAATDRRFDTTQIKQQADAFDKLNGPITKASTFYPGFEAASQQALAGNPATFKMMMSQMAAQLDPALQLRLGTLMYVQNIDPSWKGSLQRYLAEKSTGTLPPDQVRKVIAVVNAVRQKQRDLYETRRNDVVQNFPGAEHYIRSSDDIFGTMPGAPAGGAPNVNDVESYLKALRSKKP